MWDMVALLAPNQLLDLIEEVRISFVGPEGRNRDRVAPVLTMADLDHAAKTFTCFLRIEPGMTFEESQAAASAPK